MQLNWLDDDCSIDINYTLSLYVHNLKITIVELHLPIHNDY